jgi:hypothetical protein
VLVVIATMPAGTSAQAGACAVVVALLLSYAWALARAVPQTASEAARWLQGTPMRFLAFAWPLMRRALVHQAALSAGAAALLLPLGAQLEDVLYLALAWLVLVLTVWTLWLRGSFHGERVVSRAMVSVATTLGVEHYLRGYGFACALLWAMWNLRARPQ